MMTGCCWIAAANDALALAEAAKDAIVVLWQNITDIVYDMKQDEGLISG